MDGRSYRRSRMHRAVGTHTVRTLLCVLLLLSQVTAQIPYTPSNLLYSYQQNSSFAYLLRPTNTNDHRTEFLSLDVSGDIDPSKPSFTVLFDETPFHNNGEVSAYIPVIDQIGVVKVYAGDCQVSQNPPVLWRFEPDPDSSTGNGTWEKFSVDSTDGHTSTTSYGPSYLSAGFAYSPSNTTESSLFAFAGMCPYQGDGSTSWVTAANYSQTMTVLNPLLSEQDDTYRASNTGDRAPPIPEAGFTITPLQATYAYSTDELRQQQDFLLIGGHTQQAFINMSELAIFSAPQNSWSFITVESVADTRRTDLAFRNTAVIEPRSGHTAVLSPDGSKVIVFGGWVGNTSVPATPQLAILEIGGGFVGSGEWSWKVSSTMNAGIPEGSGIYGHGAAMLPGGIMVIAGGYEISHFPKRSGTGPQLNSQIYLYNVTSDTWATSYENPYSISAIQIGDDSFSSGSGSSSSRKTGLGVGIGLGVPAAAGLAVLASYFCRRRRLRRARDKDIRKLALGAQRAHFWGRDDSEMASSIRSPSMRESIISDYPWSNNKPQSIGRKSGWNDKSNTVAERTGLLGDINVAKKPSRPALNAGIYRPPKQYHDYRRGDAAGDIHPIDEREEDEAHGAEIPNKRETIDSLTEPAFVTARTTQVEEIRLPGVFPTNTESLAGGSVGGDGRLSPERGERTSSNLSDSSTLAKSAKAASVSRTVFANSLTLPSNGRHSPDKPVLTSSNSREVPRNRDSATSTTLSYEKRYSSDSYSTAHSTLSQKQAEGEHLLRESSETSPFSDLLSSKPAILTRPRASEWIGDIRRVLSVTRRRPPANETPTVLSRASGIDGRNTLIGNSRTDPRIPRRSVSASAELFRRKQGAKDWGVGNRFSHGTGFHTARSTRDDFGLDGLVDIESDEDWDVEGAAEGRRVQVTFTVPKEKLRVVNASAGDLDDLSENSISRSNSSS